MSRSSTSAGFAAGLSRHLRRHLPQVLTLDGLRDLHLTATEYHQRPSQIVGVADPLSAWVLDQATIQAGRRRRPDKGDPLGLLKGKGGA